MRYLFYTTCFTTPHLETELDIALKLINNGDEVNFLVCNRELSRCFTNPTNNQSVCSICISKTKNALKSIGLNYDSCLTFNNEDEHKIKKDFSSLDELKCFKFENCEIGLSVVSNLISYTRNHKVDINIFKDFINDGIKSAIKVYNGSSRIFNLYKPDVVYVFNGRFLENRPMLEVCNKMGITFYTHERGSTIHKYYLNKNNLPHSLLTIKLDIEKVWKEERDLQKKNRIAHDFFINRRNGKIQNWFSYISKQRKNVLPSNFDKTKKNIAIYNSSLDEYVTIPDFNNLIYEDDNDAIYKILKDFILNKNIHFYLRMHPNLSGLNNEQAIELKKISSEFNNITIIEPHSEVDSYGLMENCDIVLTMGSTMGIEALYWKKPSVLLGRAYYEDIKGMFIPKSHTEAIELINSNLKVDSNSDALKFGYWSSVYGTDHDYYIPQNLIKGKFLGKKIQPSFFLMLYLKIKNFFKLY